ncbi:Cytochrome c oxidase polypeptide III [hydrothermal vent metagenome]|uniref:cytochrome-c oxidase n=1 Tax=hydrothermal vent metagenome TaxID=652676 RepID=A0A3B0YPS9_9ZZZZ
MSSNGGYYLPKPSFWPLLGSIGLFLLVGGFAMSLPTDISRSAIGQYTYGEGASVGSLTVMYIGFGVLAVMLIGWFGQVIKESEAGLYDSQVDRSFRQGMTWFIFSEVMFFAAFFGALYYIRVLMLPWLNGTSVNPDMALTGQWLYPEFKAAWPNSGPLGPDLFAASKELTEKSFHIMGAWGIPAINTLILLTSGVTLTIAHHALKEGHRKKLITWLAATVILGFIFLALQIYEYGHAYSAMNLKMTTGSYGSTFYMLTGFHGFHVFVGATILAVLLFRSAKGHFSEKSHFAFEAGAWYWHFVDVVWLGLFIFVYWLI